MLSAANVHALNLGSLKIESDLGQPLKGEIELIVSEGDDLSLVSVTIASEKEFKKLMVAYPDYLKDVRLSLINNVSKPLLMVDSNGVAINERFIRFLARVKWPGGVFLREFTAIIDAPIYSEEPSFPISISPKVGAAKPDVLKTVQGALVEGKVGGNKLEVATDERSKAANENLSLSNSIEPSLFQGGANFGPIVSGESLSEIAAGLKAEFPDLNIYQIMKVLFEENQSAFIDGNINGLLKGSVLKVSDLSVIRSADLSESINFFVEQVNAWDESNLIASFNNKALNVGQDNYIDSSNESGTVLSAIDGDPYDGRFQVGASAEEDNLVSSGEGLSREGEVLALRQEASKLETSLASIELEKKELNERVSILEGQLSDINSLINLSLESSELTALEDTLKQKEEAKKTSKKDVVKTTKSDDGFFSDVTDAFAIAIAFIKEAATGLGEFVSESWNTLEHSVIGSDNANDPELSELESVGDKAQAPIAGVVREKSVDAKIGKNLKNTPVAEKDNAVVRALKDIFLGGGLWKVLVVLGGFLSIGLVALFLRNRREDRELDGTLEQDKLVTQSTLSDETAGTDVPLFLTQYHDSDAGAQNDDIDSAEAADVYIAYGRNEQAEEVLLSGIVSEPDRVDIKQKLLGLYFKRRNTKGFENMAKQLHLAKDTLTESEWQEIIKMGQKIAPESPLFVSRESGLPTIIENDSETQRKIDESTDLLIELKWSKSSNNELKIIDAANSSLEEGKLEYNDVQFEGFSASINDDEQSRKVLKADFKANKLIVDPEKSVDVEKSADDNGNISVSGTGVKPDYDEAQTQLQLAKVFVDLGDENGARKILLELIGNDDNDESLLADSKKLLDSIKH